MRILLGIGHPADVHFFNYFINDLKNKGNEVYVAAREKEITYYLLDELRIEYAKVSTHKKTISRKVADYFIRWARTYWLCRNVRPDIAVGVGDFYLAQIGRLMGFPSIIITDTEHVKHDTVLTFPFASHLLTPSCFLKDLGKKHIRYFGYNELAYFHKDYFTPDSGIYDLLGVKTDEKYVIMRFVARTAVHDIGQKGLSIESKREAVEKVSKYATVFISSEDELPDDLKPYLIPIPPKKMHDALYYADLLYGESSTMASEAACLGTPAIFVDDVGRGYTDEEEQKYGLVFNFSESSEDQEKSIGKAVEILNTPGIKEEWRRRRDRMLRDKIDLTAFLVWFVEEYPNSAKIMKEDPDYQLRFMPKESTDYADCTD